MAKSYLIKVANNSDRSDANTVKYWVDSYSLVSYRGESSVYKVIVGGTQLFITDPDRAYWDVTELDDAAFLKRSDYPYFKMDKYVYKGSDKALELKSSYIDNEYVGYNTAVHIQDATAYNSDSGSIINAALKVDGGGYFGKNLKVRERVIVGSENIVGDKCLDIDSAAEDSTKKAFVTISNPGAEATVDADFGVQRKGALFVDGGVVATRNIVCLGNGYVARDLNVKGSGFIDGNLNVKGDINASRFTGINVKGSGFIDGNLNVKGDINASRFTGIVALSEQSKSLIAYNTGSIYSVGVPVLAITDEMEYHPAESGMTRVYTAVSGPCGSSSYAWVDKAYSHAAYYEQIGRHKGYGNLGMELIIPTPGNKSICTAQFTNVNLPNRHSGVMFTNVIAITGSNKISVYFEVFNNASDAYTQNIVFGIRYTLVE